MFQRSLQGICIPNLKLYGSTGLDFYSFERFLRKRPLKLKKTKFGYFCAVDAGQRHVKIVQNFFFSIFSLNHLITMNLPNFGHLRPFFVILGKYLCFLSPQFDLIFPITLYQRNLFFASFGCTFRFISRLKLIVHTCSIALWKAIVFSQNISKS